MKQIVRKMIALMLVSAMSMSLLTAHGWAVEPNQEQNSGTIAEGNEEESGRTDTTIQQEDGSTQDGAWEYKLEDGTDPADDCPDSSVEAPARKATENADEFGEDSGATQPEKTAESSADASGSEADGSSDRTGEASQPEQSSAAERDADKATVDNRGEAERSGETSLPEAKHAADDSADKPAEENNVEDETQKPADDSEEAEEAGEASAQQEGSVSVEPVPEAESSIEGAESERLDGEQRQEDEALEPQDAGENGHTYRVYDESMTWEEAKAFCEEQGGHLATITSKEEELAVEEALNEGTRNCYWLGGYKEEKEWHWITDEAFEYRNWGFGQPDNYTKSEDKLMIYRNQNPNRLDNTVNKWNDIKADGTCKQEPFFGKENFGFVCEWGKRAIIVVPGICGSELKADEKINYYSPGIIMNGFNIFLKESKLWVPDGVEAEFLTQPAYANVVGCDENGKSKHKISPVIVDAEKAVEKYDNIGADDTYTKLVRLLYNKYDQKKGGDFDVCFFSYDWRMSVKKGAKKLKEYIDDKGYDQVILVCHSMGGLVASQYIEDGNGDKIEKLITIATPYLGAVKALNVLESGEFLDPGLRQWATKGSFKAFTANMPAVYELMPSNQYMKNYTIVSKRTKEKTDEPWWKFWKKYKYSGYTAMNAAETKSFIQKRHNGKLYKAALSTTDALYYSYSRHPIDQVDSYLIYARAEAGADGGWEVTIGELKYTETNGKTELDDIDVTFGDGTVPEDSATIGNRKFVGKKRNKIALVGWKDHTSVVKDISKSAQAWQYITAAIDGKWDDQTKLQSQSVESNNGMTKLRIEGNGSYTITSNSGKVLATIKDGILSAADGYENCFYALDENCSTVLAFLEPGTYQVQVDSVTSDDFECDVIEYSDYTNNQMESVTEYKLTDAVDTITDSTAAKIVTNKKEFQVDSNGDSNYDTSGTALVPVFAESVTLNRAKASIKTGKSIQLTAQVMPDNVTYPGVSWNSSNEKVATVSESGLVTGITSGKAVITAEVNGVRASATVQVKGSKLKAPVSVSAKAAKGKTIKVQWKKVKAGKGYEIQYSTDNKFKKKKQIKIKKNTTVAAVIKKLKKGTYYIRVRTVKGKDCSDWSKTIKVKVK